MCVSIPTHPPIPSPHFFCLNSIPHRKWSVGFVVFPLLNTKHTGAVADPTSAVRHNLNPLGDSWACLAHHWGCVGFFSMHRWFVSSNSKNTHAMTHVCSPNHSWSGRRICGPAPGGLHLPAPDQLPPPHRRRQLPLQVSSYLPSGRLSGSGLSTIPVGQNPLTTSHTPSSPENSPGVAISRDFPGRLRGLGRCANLFTELSNVRNCQQ